MENYRKTLNRPVGGAALAASVCAGFAGFLGVGAEMISIDRANHQRKDQNVRSADLDGQFTQLMRHQRFALEKAVTPQ